MNEEKITGTLQVTGTINGTITIGGGGGTAKLQEKTARARKNSIVEVTPDSGFDGLSKVNIRPISRSLENVTINPPTDSEYENHVSQDYAGYNVVTVTIDSLRNALLGFDGTLQTGAMVNSLGMKEVYFRGITAIADGAISDQPDLTAIHLGNSSMVTIGTGNFAISYRAINIYVPQALLAEYQADSNWSGYVANGKVAFVGE